ncbi:MAG: efflux RND transporter permease subunit [Deltaproteobacteria bacterium]|nr:efflux RND transporter permease subunit [Deltaproteobacteria bacterium]MBW2418215.1 efflux RND transporter permease subunit [Deltaproteobacteria bacterium]
MNRAIAWFAENHVAANLLMLLIIMAGLMSSIGLRQELLPEIELDIVSVTVVYPGASPGEVEEAICLRIEEELQGLQGIKRITSVAAEGAGSVTVELLAGEDLRARLDEIRGRVDAIDTFPDEAEQPLVNEVAIKRSVMQVAISGEVDEWTLKRLGEQVRDEISALPGITDVELYADRPYEIAIEVSEAAMRRHSTTFDEVVQAIRRSSLDLPGGAIKTGAGEILLRTKGQAYRGEEFERIALVSRRDGTRLALGDVARVVDGFEEIDQHSSFDGKPAVIVKIYRVGNQKTIALARTVREYVEGARERTPPGVELTVWTDSSRPLQGRLNSMLRNARGGFILVAIILALFLRLRLALWVSSGIPITFLGALATLPFLDISINIISLLGFIVVLGIVVDDAIVVGENTHTEQSRTGSKLRGAILGTQGVSVPVVFGVLTTIAAFAPMGFLPGPMGTMGAVVPKVIIACLLFSLVEALFVLPAHLGHSMRGGDEDVNAEPRNPVARRWRRFADAISGGLQRLIEGPYRRLLGRALEWRYLTVAIAVSLFLVTTGLVAGGFIRFVFQMPVEADTVVADITMPEGTPASVTAAAVARIEAAAVAVKQEIEAGRPAGAPPVITHRLAAVGEQPFRDRRQSTSGSGRRGAGGSNAGEVQLDLADARDRDHSAMDIANLWRERVGEIAGAEELTYVSTLITVSPAIEVQLRGLELDELQRAAEALKLRLAAYPGVFDIADSFRLGKQELELQLLPAGESLGVTARDLARQVRQGFYGVEVQSIQRGRDEVKVMVRYPAEERRSLADVESMRIRTTDGSEVPFAYVAKASLGRGFSAIKRIDRRRVVNVSAEVDLALANPSEIVRDLKRGAIREVLDEFPGVSHSFEGQQADQREFMAALGKGQLIALFVIYGLLAVPLRSYVQPGIIMSAIPFGLVGAVWGHLVMGFDLTMYSILGFVALSGVVVNASLVLVDYVNRRRAQGAALRESLVDAGIARFRPILLTSLTTFAGLTPLMLEQSMQARFMIPMAISISFGVLFSSFITLFLVPASYLVLEDLTGLFGASAAGEELSTTPVREVPHDGDGHSSGQRRGGDLRSLR